MRTDKLIPGCLREYASFCSSAIPGNIIKQLLLAVGLEKESFKMARRPIETKRDAFHNFVEII